MDHTEQGQPGEAAVLTIFYLLLTIFLERDAPNAAALTLHQLHGGAALSNGDSAMGMLRESATLH